MPKKSSYTTPGYWKIYIRFGYVLKYMHKVDLPLFLELKKPVC